MLVASEEATSGSVIAKADRLAGQQRLEPTLALFGGGEQLEGFHFSGVRGLAVDGLGRDDRRPTGDLGDGGVLHVAHAGQLGEEEVPQAAAARVTLEVLHDGGCSCEPCSRRCAAHTGSAGKT
jgi:hypothetical protein